MAGELASCNVLPIGPIMGVAASAAENSDVVSVDRNNRDTARE